MVGVFAIVAPVAAQPPPLHESVVVTAATVPVPFETAARAVRVLTRVEIDRLPIRSIDDLLRLVASVDVRARGPQAQADFAIRGASFGQTLVLVDGIRINDAQSGHHNSDIPVTLDDIARVEILPGAGSSLFGADAFGGTINIITRSDAGPRAQAAAFVGAHGLAGARARVAIGTGEIRQTLSAEVNRSSGFVADRDFETIAASSRTQLGSHTRLQLGLVRKRFGAAGFYGPAPSREHTDQTMAAVRREMIVGGWRSAVEAAYRTHGDFFIYDARLPGQSENTHRTHALAVVARGHRQLGPTTRVSAGAETGGDWITSSNLGDHRFGKASGFVELQHVAGRAIFYPGLRFDRYSRFGSAWSPSIATRLGLHRGLSLRGSVGRAFRVPTFTELYYRDPNHDASGSLRPERGWSAEVGGDWLAGASTLARATVFVRRERDVIDWIRPSAADRWRTTNVHRVRAAGLELGLRRRVGETASLDVEYTALRTRAAALDGMLSKYVLDYAAHLVAASATMRVPWGIDVGPRVGWNRRNDGRDAAVADMRIARTAGRATLYLDATNLFDERYEEIRGVAMPGRAFSAGVRLSTGSR